VDADRRHRAVAVDVSPAGFPDVFAAVVTAATLAGPALLASGALHTWRHAHPAQPADTDRGSGAEAP
jgi:hypothetical protein